MSKKIKAIRGMNDLLPADSQIWSFLDSSINNLLLSYGYKYCRTPNVESTETFSRAIGEVTDIVEKEMYTWKDNNGDSLTLRPEGTAGVVRMMIEHNLPREGIQKVFYNGPMFRHERPQKGRYRQFHQVGAEVFGASDAKIDAELISIQYGFCTCKSCERIQSPYNCVLRKALVPEMFLDMHNVTRNCLDLI